MSQIFASIPLDKEGNDVVTVGLSVRSTATPVITHNQQMATRYEIEYADPLSDGISRIQFSFSDDLVKRASQLGDGPFSFSDKPASLKFTDGGPPTNVIGTIVFVGPDGYGVGSMPVSLAVPSD
jgi:hypothetical protein